MITLTKESITKYISSLSEDDIKDRLDNYSSNSFIIKFGYYLMMNHSNEIPVDTIKSNMLDFYFYGNLEFLETVEVAKLIIKYQICHSEYKYAASQEYRSDFYRDYLEYAIGILAEIRIKNG